MLDFRKELDKLLALEAEPLPQNELAALAEAEQLLLRTLNKKQTDISMQVEEIYDLVQDIDVSPVKDSLLTEKKNSGRLLMALMGLCDMIDDFCIFARKSGVEGLERHSLLMWKNTEGMLEGCGVTRLGENRQPFNPEIHTVQGAVASDIPAEHVAEVLRSGYRYMGEVARKAAVTLSTGTEAENGR